jgi:hypothetical protein
MYFYTHHISLVPLDNVNSARVMRKMRPIQRDDVLASYLTVNNDNAVNKTMNDEE